MALRIYYDKDADLGRLEGKTVADASATAARATPTRRTCATPASTWWSGLRKDSPILGQGRGGGPARCVEPARGGARGATS